jgi:hypothetical protein
VYQAPPVFEILYQLGELELAHRAHGAEAADRAIEALVVRGHAPLVREPDGGLYTPAQFRARRAEPPRGPRPEEILAAVLASRKGAR